MKTLMIIGAGPLQTIAYEQARQLGLRTVAIDRNPAAPGMRLADVAHVVDTRDCEGAIRVARGERINGVMTLCTDMPVVTVAAVAEALGLPGLKPEQAQRATDKALMRDAFQTAGAPIPRYRRAGSLEEVRRSLEEIGFPAILKPPRSSGSRGVFKLSCPEDLPRGYAHAASVAGDGAAILVEEFVEGPEVSVETISHAGAHHVLAVTDKRTTGDPHWVETGHVEPSSLPESVLSEVAAVTRQGLEALGLMDSAAHVEIKVGRAGPRLIEIGARLGGDFISTELVRRSTGIDMTRAAIALALGEVPDLRPTRSNGAAIRYLLGRPGRVVSVSGLQDAWKVAGVKTVVVEVAPGDEIRPVLSSLDRPGYVIAEGPDASAAEASAAAAVDAIRLEIA